MVSTLKEIIEKKESQIIIVFSRGTMQDLVLDIFFKKELTLSDSDKMMLRNLNLLEIINDKEENVEGQN